MKPSASRRFLRLPVAVAIFTATLAGTLAGTLAAQPETAKRYRVGMAEGYITITVDEAGGIPIKDFIKIAGDYTGKVFTYDNNDFQNPETNMINFIGPMKVKKENFFSFFQTVLYMKDFACVVRGEGDTEMVQIIFIRGPKRPEIQTGARLVLPEDLERYKNQTGVQVVTSIRLEHVPASKATQTLRPFFASAAGGASGVQIGTVGNDRNVLLQGFGTQVYQAAKLFELVDQPDDILEVVIEPHRLVYANAEELEPLLNELLGDRNRPRPGQPAQAGVAGQTTTIKILSQPTTNTLILSGTRAQVNEAKDIIAELDQPLEVTGGDSHVIHLQNVLAKDLRDTMNRFITDELQAEQQARAGQGQQARRPRKPVIIAHEESNSILLSAPASKFAQLKQMIDELDVRQPQVLIECAVVELQTTDLMRYGIELGFLDLGAEGENWKRGFGFLNAGLTTFDDTDGDGLPDTRLPDFENPLRGFTGGIISSDDFAIPVLINALNQTDTANVLSMPSVLVNNNENALVESKEDRPTTEANQGTATTQTSFGGFEPAGITLEISPSISTNNYLRLNITLEVSRFTTPFDPNAATPGVKATRKVTTQVTMPSHHTMVLGGVIEDAESKTEEGIPFLKDIPVLGWLFKSKTNENRKINLYFFLTPHILDEDDFSDLDNLSFRKKLEAEQYIGRRRIQIMDPKWRGQAPGILEDPHSTIEDLDRHTNSEFPEYRAPVHKTTATQPAMPKTTRQSVNIKENK